MEGVSSSAAGGAAPAAASAAAVPALVFPPRLAFYSDDQSSHKQLLTIYNPFDWQFRFKILCTSARQYIVRPPNGTLRPRSSVDVVIRLREFGTPRKDKFMVQILNDANTVLNSKKITADVMLGHQQSNSPPPMILGRDERAERRERRDSNASQDSFGSSAAQSSAPSSRPRSHRQQVKKAPTSGLKLRLVVFALLSGVLIVSVMLPASTWLPPAVVQRLLTYFSLSTWQQLLGAFILGMIAMSFMRDL